MLMRKLLALFIYYEGDLRIPEDTCVLSIPPLFSQQSCFYSLFSSPFLTYFDENTLQQTIKGIVVLPICLFVKDQFTCL